MSERVTLKSRRRGTLIEMLRRQVGVGRLVQDCTFVGGRFFFEEELFPFESPSHSYFHISLFALESLLAYLKHEVALYTAPRICSTQVIS